MTTKTKSEKKETHINFTAGEPTLAILNRHCRVNWNLSRSEVIRRLIEIGDKHYSDYYGKKGG